MDAPKLEFRCPTDGCGRLLFKIAAEAGTEVETVCPRCKNTVTARLTDEGQGDAE